VPCGRRSASPPISTPQPQPHCKTHCQARDETAAARHPGAVVVAGR
jgi:hypothetical protein